MCDYWLWYDQNELICSRQKPRRGIQTIWTTHSECYGNCLAPRKITKIVRANNDNIYGRDTHHNFMFRLKMVIDGWSSRLPDLIAIFFYLQPVLILFFFFYRVDTEFLQMCIKFINKQQSQNHQKSLNHCVYTINMIRTSKIQLSITLGKMDCSYNIVICIYIYIYVFFTSRLIIWVSFVSCGSVSMWNVVITRKPSSQIKH